MSTGRAILRELRLTNGDVAHHPYEIISAHFPGGMLAIPAQHIACNGPDSSVRPVSLPFKNAPYLGISWVRAEAKLQGLAQGGPSISNVLQHANELMAIQEPIMIAIIAAANEGNDSVLMLTLAHAIWRLPLEQSPCIKVAVRVVRGTSGVPQFELLN